MHLKIRIDQTFPNSIGEETLVVFTSDYGELLGTHGLLHKGPLSYKQLVEIALLIRGPGVDAAKVSDALTKPH